MEECKLNCGSSFREILSRVAHDSGKEKGKKCLSRMIDCY